MSTLERADQIAAALRVTEALRAQGWAKAMVEVKAEGDKVVRPAFGTGRGR
jgi:hypothetical protein